MRIFLMIPLKKQKCSYQLHLTVKNPVWYYQLMGTASYSVTGNQEEQDESVYFCMQCLSCQGCITWKWLKWYWVKVHLQWSQACTAKKILDLFMSTNMNDYAGLVSKTFLRLFQPFRVFLNSNRDELEIKAAQRWHWLSYSVF